MPLSTVVSASVEQPQAVISLDAAIQEYMDEVRRFRSPKTIAACENMLSRFGAGLPVKLIKDITRKNLLDHMPERSGRLRTARGRKVKSTRQSNDQRVG
jgi:hypothetical protein